MRAGQAIGGGGRCVQVGRNGTCKGPEVERSLGFLRTPARRQDARLEVALVQGGGLVKDGEEEKVKSGPSYEVGRSGVRGEVQALDTGGWCSVSFPENEQVWRQMNSFRDAFRDS